MIIKEIKIKNFKSFGNTEQSLILKEDVGELILLMGSNGVGKSLIPETEIEIEIPIELMNKEEIEYLSNLGIYIGLCKITLGQLFELNKKFNIIEKYDIKVQTRNDLKKIKAIGITSPDSTKIKISTKNFNISGSPYHRVIKNGEWVFLKDLSLEDSILTKNDYEPILMIEEDNFKEDLYDIEVDGNEYYSNGIISHNSTFLAATDFSLYGKCKGTKKKWATLSTLPNRINGSDMLVSIKFKAASDDIEIVRGISPNVLKLVENGVVNEKAGKANLDEKIEKYVGMDIETFKSFISLSINDFKNFMSLSNDEKQILLDKLFNLEVINVLNQILKDLNKNNKQQLIKYDSEISTLDDSIQSIKRSINNAVEKEKENIQDEIDEIKKMMDSKKDDYQTLKDKVEKVKNKEYELKNELDKEREQSINISNEIRSAQKDIDLYDSGKCPTCRTDFDNDHFQNLKDVLLEKKRTIELIKNEIDNNIKSIREKQSKLQTISDNVNKAFTDLTYLLKNYKSQIDKLNNKKVTENVNTNISEFEKTIVELDNKKENSRENQNTCKEKESYYKELSKIFGEDGVKKSIISGIIKPINYFLNDNISKMGLPFQVDLDETFTANIKQFGVPIEQDSLSTGESKLINISILVSYLKLIRTKKTVNILFLDEVFSSIDIENIEKILNLLKSFAHDYKINIFVVHHALMNEELFDRIIRIEKNVFSEIIEVK